MLTDLFHLKYYVSRSIKFSSEQVYGVNLWVKKGHHLGVTGCEHPFCIYSLLTNSFQYVSCCDEHVQVKIAEK